MYVFQIWVTLPFILAALPQTAFVVLYGLPALGAGEWWREPVGRALFFKSVTLAALLDTLAIRLTYHVVTADDVQWWFAPPTRAIDRFGAILYWLIFAAVVYQLVVLVRQRVRSPGLHDYPTR